MPIVMAAVLAAAGLVVGANAPRVAATSSISVQGAGFGHGIGLSQWGAYGYAVDHGWTASQILDRFYGGTVAATVAAQDIAVRLTLHDDRQTSAVSDTGSLIVEGYTPGGPWRSVVVREIGGVYRVFARADAMVCPDASASLTTGWTPLSGSSSSVTIRTATDTTSSAAYGDLVSVCEPNGRVRSYRGLIRAVNGSAGENRTINVVPLEQYLRSVVASEVPWTWGNAAGGAGAQALQAQAVAARSYALAENRYSYARTCDLMACQVYLGAAWRTGLGAAFTRIEQVTTDAAVAATAGAVRRVGSVSGPIAYAMFSSSSGGQTAPSTLGFTPVVDEGDDTTANPYFRWTATLSATTVQNAYPAIGSFTGITVLGRDGAGPWGGRVTSLRVEGTAGSVTVTGDRFRSAVGLRSTLFTTGSAPSPSPGPLPPSPVGQCGSRVPPPVVGMPTPDGAARFVPVAPVRLVDTREGFGAPSGEVPGGCTLAVSPNVPDGATAAVVNVTAVGAAWDGFVTIYACGEARPLAANTQTTTGRTVGGATIVPIGSDGRFCVYTHATTHLVVDLFGYYAPGDGLRFEPVDAARLLDTRAGRTVPAGSVTRLRVSGKAGVAAGASAAALTVQASAAAGPGYVTVYPCSAQRPLVSSLNMAPGEQVVNHVEVGLSPEGDVCLFNWVAVHLIVDVSGWFGPGASSEFYAVTPVRSVDTRNGTGLSGAFAAGANRDLGLAGTVGLPGPERLRAVAGVVTTTESQASGFVTVHACRTPVPQVSMVRFAPRVNVATTVIGNVDSAGRWCVMASATTHLVLDVNGFFAA
jgi:SpoIID/LytB domain protein